MSDRKSIDEVLAETRAELHRVTPTEAHEQMQSGALLVDTRTEPQRREAGDVPGALRIDRTVLEWRLDPASPHRIPQASYDRRILVLCRQGYSSSLAAASLRLLGLDATDVIGGMEAWVAAGLPVEPADPRT